MLDLIIHDSKHEPGWFLSIADGSSDSLLDTISGRRKYFDGSSYRGETKNGLREGRAFLLTPENNYAGTFKDGKRHGEGKCDWRDGSYYEGEWMDDEMHGRGTFKFEDGSVYSGSWFRGWMKSGTFLWSDNTQYSG